MAEPQLGALASGALPRLWWRRAGTRPTAALWHRAGRPCLAAFTLLARLVRRQEGRSCRRTGGNGDREEKYSPMTKTKPADGDQADDRRRQRSERPESPARAAPGARAHPAVARLSSQPGTSRPPPRWPGQAAASAAPQDGWQRIVDGLGLTEWDNGVIPRHGVSLLREVQAGFHPPRYATLLRQPSPSFGHSSRTRPCST